MEIPENLRLFEREDNTEEAQYFYEILMTEQLPELPGKVIARRRDLLVSHPNPKQPDLEARKIGIKSNGQFYALYLEEDACHSKAWVKQSQIFSMKIDVFFDSLLALERRMISRNAIVLHSAYLKNGNTAILFSAPSGVGKSTQASLWEKYRGGQTMNGDRSLLIRSEEEGGVWYANGWPVCGSSEICNNITMPVRAIVMLSQAPVNKVRRLSAFEAFRLVFEQVTANGWNPDFVGLVMDEVEQLISEVPVYHLACTISEEAVTCLEEALNAEEHAKSYDDKKTGIGW